MLRVHNIYQYLRYNNYYVITTGGVDAGVIVEPEENASTVSDVPTVQHFNISVSESLQLQKNNY